jgi:hypothetical protein
VPLKIGWLLTAHEGGIAYDPPSRFVVEKDASLLARGVLSCPAVRSYYDGVFQILAPFSLRLRCVKEAGSLCLKQIYPFTSLTESKFREFVTVEPPDTWRNSHTVMLQLPSPYLFFSDEHATIEQFQPSLTTVSAMNWRVIPGKFDIYSWQRPLNWGIEWDTNLGDLVIRAGEPLYFIKFQDSLTGKNSANLVECRMTPALEERMKLSRGITAIRKGAVPLMKAAGKLRDGVNLINPKSSD